MMSKREKTIVIVAGSVIGALLLDRVLVTPLWGSYIDAEGRIKNAREDLDRADALERNALRARDTWSEMAGDTLPSDASQAESQLLNGVRVWAQQAGVNLTSLKPEVAESEETFDRLIVRAAATGDMESLSRFLYAAETSRIPVRVAEVTLASRRDGENDLSLQVGFATIYEPPATEEETP